VATLDSTVVDQIRVEIRKRLIFFQACTDAARRRGAADVRRLLATWLIAADGTIKSIKLEGVEEEETTACLVRAGSRPFSVKPGMDVTIPTPIVFVR
jgi:hypothetical protein